MAVWGTDSLLEPLLDVRGTAANCKHETVQVCQSELASGVFFFHKSNV